MQSRSVQNNIPYSINPQMGFFSFKICFFCDIENLEKLIFPKLSNSSKKNQFFSPWIPIFGMKKKKQKIIIFPLEKEKKKKEKTYCPWLLIFERFLFYF